jgi:hypothetical protein
MTIITKEFDLLVLLHVTVLLAGEGANVHSLGTKTVTPLLMNYLCSAIYI